MANFFSRQQSARVDAGSMRLYPPSDIAGQADQAAFDGKWVQGTCPVCGERGRFGRFTDNLRESGACSHCACSNRQRQMAWMLRRTLSLPATGMLALPKGMTIYNTEANGPLHGILKSHPDYQCSEYWGGKAEFGDKVNGVRNEDLQALGFADASFDVVLSSDVLEHVPDPYQAHREIYRVLKTGGRHVFTAPYGEAMLRDDVRASLVEEKIVYHAPALYHGDPVRPGEGILVWTIFGLEMLVRLKEIGFDTELWRLREPGSGIVGPGAIVFVARKP